MSVGFLPGLGSMKTFACFKDAGQCIQYFRVESQKHNQLKTSCSNIHIRINFVAVILNSNGFRTNTVSYCQSTVLPVLNSVSRALANTVGIYGIYVYLGYYMRYSLSYFSCYKSFCVFIKPAKP